MNLVQALTYLGNETDLLNKLAMVAFLTAASVVLMPLIGLGLIPLAVLLGYGLQIANGVRRGERFVLPPWNDYAGYLAAGSRLLPALLFYHVPVLLFGVCLLLVPGAFRTQEMDALATLTALLCMLPLTTLYLAIIWPMLAVGAVRYLDEPASNDYFKLARLFEISSDIRTYSIQWVLAAFIVNLLVVGLAVIPFLGWLVIALLTIPVHGHLLGQYARLLDEHRRRRNAALRT